MSVDAKKEYETKATELKSEHQKMYPHYKYRPKKRPPKTASGNIKLSGTTSTTSTSNGAVSLNPKNQKLAISNSKSKNSKAKSKSSQQNMNFDSFYITPPHVGANYPEVFNDYNNWTVGNSGTSYDDFPYPPNVCEFSVENGYPNSEFSNPSQFPNGAKLEQVIMPPCYEEIFANNVNTFQPQQPLVNEGFFTEYQINENQDGFQNQMTFPPKTEMTHQISQSGGCFDQAFVPLEEPTNLITIHG